MAVPPVPIDPWVPATRDTPRASDAAYVPGYAAAPGYIPVPDQPYLMGPPPLAPRSLRGLGTLTASLLFCQVAVWVAGAGIAAWGVLSWSRISGASADLQLPSDKAGVLLLLVSWPLTLVTGVTFVAWLYVAAENARRSGAALRRSPGWAIGGWFVPILSLWRPKQVLDDVWRGSKPGVPAGIDLRRVPKSGLITGWWAAYLLASALPTVGFMRGFFTALRPNLEALRTGNTSLAVPIDMARFHETVALWSLWAAVLLVIAAGLAAVVVLRVTNWQHQRATGDAA